MKRVEYLKEVVNYGINNIVTTKSWFVTAFAMTKPKDADISKLNTYELIRESWGMSFRNNKGELEKIEDSKPNEPLFSFKEKITIDNTWLPNVKQ